MRHAHVAGGRRYYQVFFRPTIHMWITGRTARAAW